MADISSLVINVLRVSSAFNNVPIPGDKEHALLVQDYTLSMRILEDCAAIAKAVPDGEVPKVMEEATVQCINLAEEVVVRQEKWSTRKGALRQVTGLASWEKLERLNNAFRHRVLTLHTICQRHVVVQYRANRFC